MKESMWRSRLKSVLIGVVSEFVVIVPSSSSEELLMEGEHVTTYG